MTALISQQFSQQTKHPEHIPLGFGSAGLYTTKLVNAAVVNNIQAVKSLLKQGDNPFLRTIETIPRNALEYAKNFDAPDTALILKEYMDKNPLREFELLNLSNQN